jgi:hypothetical protein
VPEIPEEAGLPVELVAALRDGNIILPQDQSVFELIAAWQNAPADTPSSQDWGPFIKAICAQERERLLSAEVIRRGAMAALPEAFPAPGEQNDPEAWLDEDVEWAENIVRTAFCAALDQEDSGV